MISHLYHLLVNIDLKNISFYKNLMEYMGWKVIFEDKYGIGYRSATNGDVWFVKTKKNKTVDYDAKGVNHISFQVDKMTDVDKVKNHLEKNKVKMLFDTPRHRPEFSASEKETYYQIMFESPDKILFEVVYIGKKTKNENCS